MVLLLVLALTCVKDLSAEETLRVQLQWFMQQSSAYITLPINNNHGYSDEGITVAVFGGGPNVNAGVYVAKGVADIGYAWLEPVLTTHATMTDLVIVAQMYQKSSQKLITTAKSGLTTLASLRGKKIGTWGGTNSQPLTALANVGLLAGLNYTNVNLGANPYPILSDGPDKLDAVQVLFYNEYAQLLTLINPETGALYSKTDFNVIDIDGDSAVMEECIFVRKDWLNDTANQVRLLKFLTAVTKAAVFCRDHELEAIKFAAPTSKLDQWQLHECNKAAWATAPQTNMFGFVNETLFNQTIRNLIGHSGLLDLDYSGIVDNSWISQVNDELATQSYILNKQASVNELTWCLDTINNNIHTCTGNEKYQHIVEFNRGIRWGIIITGGLLSLVTLAILVYVIIHRESPAFRMGSPEYLYMILTGSLMLFVGPIVYAAKINPATCDVYIWFISLGFTLAFAPGIGKTYRIRKIFTMSHLRPTGVNGYYIFSIVASMIIVDLILLVLFSTIIRVKVYPIVSPVDVYTLHMTCHWPKILGYMLISYKGVLIAISLIMAILVRDVPVTLLNESRIMSWSIFGTTFVTLPVFAVIFYQSNPNTALLIGNVGIFIVGTLIVGLMFAEKIILTQTKTADELSKLYKRKGDSNYSRSHAHTSSR
jgi:NitT/TauT family transport system substrate-binding protein